LALVRAEWVEVEKIFSANDVFLVEVDEPEVSVQPGGNLSLVPEAESFSDVRGCKSCDER
jgi:hypothetical protein